jgi:transposase-like protein
MDLTVRVTRRGALRHVLTKKWKMPAREWSAAKAQFALVFGDRFEVNH